MEAPVRIFNPIALNRRLFFAKPATARFRSLRFAPKSPPVSRRNLLVSTTQNPNPNPDPFALFLSRSSPQSSGCIWYRSSPQSVGSGRERRVVTVVLLGWLGSKTKHLRRYVDWYNSRGFDAVKFVVEVREVLWFDLGGRIQKRVGSLADELALWVLDEEGDGGGDDRCLIFHTFSNTGWLAYGAILYNFQGRRDLMERIGGCVVDSGGGHPFDLQVWAAGFSSALLKRRSIAGSPTAEASEPNRLEKLEVIKRKMQDKKPQVFETLLLFLLGKFFTYFLSLPDVDRRLKRTVSFLSKHQPACSQLYLYSTADKVIPFRSIESRMEEQRRLGRKVRSYNFGSSPHVDHYRTFRNMYSSVLHSFLEECLAMLCCWVGGLNM